MNFLSISQVHGDTLLELRTNLLEGCIFWLIDYFELFLYVRSSKAFRQW